MPRIGITLAERVLIIVFEPRPRRDYKKGTKSSNL